MPLHFLPSHSFSPKDKPLKWNETRNNSNYRFDRSTLNHCDYCIACVNFKCLYAHKFRSACYSSGPNRMVCTGCPHIIPCFRLLLVDFSFTFFLVFSKISFWYKLLSACKWKMKLKRYHQSQESAGLFIPNTNLIFHFFNNNRCIFLFIFDCSVPLLLVAILSAVLLTQHFQLLRPNNPQKMRQIDNKYAFLQMCVS